MVGLSRARACEKDKNAILAAAREYLDDKLSAARTFKVETKRADKSFPMTSIQLSQYVGGELDELYPNLRWTSTTRSSRSTWRFGTMLPSSTRTRSRGPGACLWASEIEEFPIAVTKARFDGKRRW